MIVRRASPWFVLLFGIFCISASAIFLRKALVDGAAAAFYRVLFALAVTAPVFFLRKRRPVTWKDAAVCMAAGVFFGCELVFWNIAVMTSGATVPTLLVNLSVIWVAMGASLFLGEKTGPAHWIGSVVALAGVVVLSSGKNVFRSGPDMGIAFSIVASLLLTGYLLLMKSARRNADTVSALFFALVGSLLPPVLYCAARGIALSGYPAESWFYLVCIGVLTQAGGYFSINYALGHIDSIKVSLLTVLQPAVTAVLAWIFLSEIPGGNSLAGGAVVLIGLFVSFAGAARSRTTADRRLK